MRAKPREFRLSWWVETCVGRPAGQSLAGHAGKYHYVGRPFGTASGRSTAREAVLRNRAASPMYACRRRPCRRQSRRELARRPPEFAAIIP